MTNIERLNKVLGENGLEIDPRVKIKILKELFPIERLPSPSTRRSFEYRIKANLKSIKVTEREIEKRLIMGVDKYERALREVRKGGDDKTLEIKQEIIDAHKTGTNKLIGLIYHCLMDSVQLTDNVKLKSINKDTRNYADGYLSHFSQAVSRIKGLKERLWI